MLQVCFVRLQGINVPSSTPSRPRSPQMYNFHFQTSKPHKKTRAQCNMGMGLIVAVQDGFGLLSSDNAVNLLSLIGVVQTEWQRNFNAAVIERRGCLVLLPKEVLNCSLLPDPISETDANLPKKDAWLLLVSCVTAIHGTFKCPHSACASRKLHEAPALMQPGCAVHHTNLTWSSMLTATCGNDKC